MKQANIHIEWLNNGTNNTSQPQVVYNSETTQSSSNSQDHPNPFQLSESDCIRRDSKQTAWKSEDDAVFRDASGKCQQQQVCHLLEQRPSAKGSLNGSGSGNQERNHRLLQDAGNRSTEVRRHLPVGSLERGAAREDRQRHSPDAVHEPGKAHPNGKVTCGKPTIGNVPWTRKKCLQYP